MSITNISIPYEFTNNTDSSAPEVNANFDAVESKVNELVTAANTLDTGKADTSGETYTGTHNFTGATVTVAAPVSGSNPATKTFAEGLAFAAALPAQTGNAGKFVKTNGSTASWEYAACELLSTVSASNSATVDIETTFDATYSAYLLVINDLLPATDGTDLRCRMKIGGSYLTTSTYSHDIMRAGTLSEVTAADHIVIAANLDNEAVASSNYDIRINNPTKTGSKHAIFWHGHSEVSALIELIRGTGNNSTTGALTGLRFYMSTGNIASGKFSLYGLR